MTPMTSARTTKEPRVEDDALVRGAGRFTDDPRLERQAFAVFVRSPHAHARIVSVNVAPFTHSALRGAIAATADRDRPIWLGLANAGHERTVAIRYRGGLRYPRIARSDDTPDRLAEILAPR